jgi:hypothetical protein
MLYERYLQRGQALGDFCCGQGGDLSKAAYQKASCYVGVDFSSVAIEEARFRAKTTPVVQRSIGEMVFHEQDLRREVLAIDPPLDVVSCQLAAHYLWSSPAEADTFLTSVRTSLKVGGFFILTVVDSHAIPPSGILDHPYIRLTPPSKPSRAHPQTPPVASENGVIQEQPMTGAMPAAAEASPPTSLAAGGSMAGGMTAQMGALSGEGKEATKGPFGKVDLSALGAMGTRYRFSFPGLVDDVEEFVVPREDLVARCASHSLQIVHSFGVSDVFDELMAMHPTKPPLTDQDWRVLNLYRAYAFQKR